MARVTQKLQYEDFSSLLAEDYIRMEWVDCDLEKAFDLELTPNTAEQASAWAMILRRTAKCLEEMGKGLPNE